MEIPTKKIASAIEKSLKKSVQKLKKKQPLKLVTFLVGKTSEQLSYVKIKEKVARKLGIKFELIHFKATPSFEKFLLKIKEKSEDLETTAIIIQQPLPASLSTESIYEYIPTTKEIEGHKRKALFLPPIGLAILTILKYIYIKVGISQLTIDLGDEKNVFKKIFRNKRVVLIGRGITGGTPIGKTLTVARINYINVNSITPDPHSYYKEADVIISAVGKKIINPDMLKPNVALINVGLRKENGNLKGDYEEKEIKKIASFYTKTPGGVGPIDVLYLYKNLIDAAKLQM